MLDTFGTVLQNRLDALQDLVKENTEEHWNLVGDSWEDYYYY